MSLPKADRKRAAFFDKVRDLLDEDDPSLNPRLLEIMYLFASRSDPPDPIGLYPEYPQLKERFLRAIDAGESDDLEEAFLTLYAHLHGHQAPYTSAERRRMDATGGYWCHAGGLSPIIRAAPFIHSRTRSADFGAGNGLQLLLMQVLYPHRRSLMIEISSQMVEAGQALQQWLEIPEERVNWLTADVTRISPESLDFIYLYRPVRPRGPGEQFYRRFAATLDETTDDVVIFSIADCLRPFLSDDYKIFYTDGHLTCYHRK